MKRKIEPKSTTCVFLRDETLGAIQYLLSIQAAKNRSQVIETALRQYFPADAYEMGRSFLINGRFDPKHRRPVDIPADDQQEPIGGDLY